MTSQPTAVTPWTGAELRARLYRLGLTIKDFSDLTHIDERFIRRVITGAKPCSRRIEQAIIALENRAEDLLDDMVDTADGGHTVLLPKHASQRGATPGGWRLALASRLLTERPDANLDWDNNEEGGTL